MASPWTVGALADSLWEGYVVGDATFQLVGAYDPAIGCYDTTGTSKSGVVMRWTGVDIPEGATATEAYFSVRAIQSQSGNTVNSYIQGNKDANPAAFSLADTPGWRNRRGTLVGGANNNYLTTAQVAWNSMAAQTAGTWYNSPDIKDIVNEYLGLAGRVSGNAFALFWDDLEGRGTQTTGIYRMIYSYGDEAASAPKLYVTYTMPSSADGRNWHVIMGN
jgi:hypothetical protein